METEKKLFTKRNIVILLLLLIMLIAIPFGLRLVQQQQELRSRASGEDNIQFVGSNVTTDDQGNHFTSSPDIQIQLNSPFGASQ